MLGVPIRAATKVAILKAGWEFFGEITEVDGAKPEVVRTFGRQFAGLKLCKKVSGRQT